MLLHRSRANELMRLCGLDALVAASPVNITYFSDYFCWLDPLFKTYMMSPGASSSLGEVYALFPLEAEPALVVNPIFAANAADLWVDDLFSFGDSGMDFSVSTTPTNPPDRKLFDLLQRTPKLASPREALLQILKARGLTDARIGLEMEGLPEHTRAAILAALPRATIKDCSNLIRLLRAVKSSDEIQRLTRSAEISEQAAMESLAIARPGLPMGEIVQHYRMGVAEMGAALDHFAFSPRGVGIATEPAYHLNSDDVLYVDFGCIFGHCFSDTGTTLAMRELPPPLKDRHAALRECVDAGADAMRPGVKASEVQKAMWTTFTAYGFTACFPHGHGLGLEVRDYPIIVPDNGLRLRDDCIDISSDLPIEEGMVNNLEAGMFLPGVGSLQIEKSFLVGRAGSRELVSQQRAQPVRPIVG